MDARERFEIQTRVMRTLIEAGLDPTAVTDPGEVVARLAQSGSVDARRLLRDMAEAGL